MTTATITRPKFITRQILLRTEQQKGILLSLIANLPLDEWVSNG